MGQQRRERLYAGRRGQVNAYFCLTLSDRFYRRLAGTGSLGPIRFGRGSDGSGIRISQAAAASAARSFLQDQGYAAIMEGRLSAARGVVPGGMRDDRERRRL